MANRDNRFAALSPEFEEEERKKASEAQKAKKEAAKVAKVPEQPIEAAKPESAPKERHPQPADEAPQDRSYGRGYGRGYGSSGVMYVPKGSAGQRDTRDYHYRGDANATHPYDRRSGTGRGYEIPKGGSGRRNWGTPGEEQYVDERFGETNPAEPITKPKEEGEKKDIVQAPAVPAKEGEHKQEEAKVSAKDAKDKKDRKKRRKEGKKEEKKEEEHYDPNAMTYEEYMANVAKAQKELPAKKAMDTKVVLDPKKAAEITPYVKHTLSHLSDVAATKAPVEDLPAPAAASSGQELLGTLLF